MRRIFVTVLFTVLGVVLCWGSDGAAQQQDKVTIAIVIEQSGPGAAVGARWIRGVQMAADEINTGGGLLGKRIDTFILDTKTEAPVAVAAMRKAIESKPFVVMGPIFSGSALAVMGLVRDAGIPEFVGSESPNVAKQNAANNPNTFLGSLNVELSMQKVAKWIREVLQAKKIALIWANDELGKSGREALKKLLEPQGVQFVTDISTELGQSSFAGELSRIKASGADTLFIYMHEEESGKLLPQVRELGLDKQMKIVGHDTLLTEDTLRLAKDAANGVVGHVGLSPVAAPLKPVADKYLAKYQELPDHNFYKSYISMHLIKAVVEQNKSFDQQKFREKLKNNTFCVKDYPSLLMNVHYDEKGDLDRESFLIRIENQKQVMAGILGPLHAESFAGCNK
ncbi:MAG: ABC transporter substrate-binding protein [Candidatus Methylomirabilota bacterium]|jgi:branched-chain amino acid transport system substrate-binding protein